MNTHQTLEEIEHSYGITYCKECELINNCPIQKEKDEHEGNPFKEILGCSNGVRPIIMVKGEYWHNEQKDLHFSAEKISRPTVRF